MSGNDDARPLSLLRPQQRATEIFNEFAAADRVRRQDSGADFDQALYDEAVALVLGKLKKLEQETAE